MGRTEGGDSEQGIRFQAHLCVVVLCVTGSAGGFMTDCMDWFLLCPKEGTAAHTPSISMCSKYDPAHILQTCL